MKQKPWDHPKPKDMGEAICFFAHMICSVTNGAVNVERIELNDAGWDEFVKYWPDAAKYIDPRVMTIAGETIVQKKRNDD